MRPFKFRLENIYQIRKKEEQLAQQLYLFKQQQVLEKQQEIQKLDYEKQQILVEKNSSIEYMKLSYQYAAKIEEVIFEEYARLSLLQDAVDEALASLSQTRKKGKILEKLREKQESSFLEEMKKHEQRELDEFKYYPLFISKKGDH